MFYPFYVRLADGDTTLAGARPGYRPHTHIEGSGTPRKDPRAAGRCSGGIHWVSCRRSFDFSMGALRCSTHHRPRIAGNLTQDVTQRVTPNRRMRERCVQVHCVVVATPVLADTQHPGPSQVTDDSPNRTPSEAHGVSDVSCGALRVRRNVEKHGAVTRREIPLVLYGM